MKFLQCCTTSVEFLLNLCLPLLNISFPNPSIFQDRAICLDLLENRLLVRRHHLVECLHGAHGFGERVDRLLEVTEKLVIGNGLRTLRSKCITALFDQTAELIPLPNILLGLIEEGLRVDRRNIRIFIASIQHNKATERGILFRELLRRDGVEPVAKRRSFVEYLFGFRHGVVCPLPDSLDGILELFGGRTRIGHGGRLPRRDCEKFLLNALEERGLLELRRKRILSLFRFPGRNELPIERHERSTDNISTRHRALFEIRVDVVDRWHLRSKRFVDRCAALQHLLWFLVETGARRRRGCGFERIVALFGRKIFGFQRRRRRRGRRRIHRLFCRNVLLGRIHHLIRHRRFIGISFRCNHRNNASGSRLSGAGSRLPGAGRRGRRGSTERVDIVHGVRICDLLPILGELQKHLRSRTRPDCLGFGNFAPLGISLGFLFVERFLPRLKRQRSILILELSISCVCVGELLPKHFEL